MELLVGLKVTALNYIFIIVLCLITMPCKAEAKKIYVWRDSKGVLVFSDTPQAKTNIEEIKLNSKNITTIAQQDNPLFNPPDPDNTMPVKFSIAVINPTNNETIRDNSGSVHISGRIAPRFENGQTVQLLLDGIKQGTPQPSVLFVLRNVDRGQHQIELQLLDIKKQVVASSEAIAIFLHRNSVITGP
jgi:hypothetical protein